ncbi:NADPH:quinone oxidoreductase [Sphingomonas oleivorans]|uniref:NADPH:quinone oxidoreductase n=1 Tax=Sphingomonas oleivorans TaxID=1735121 RepID=A0A2T5FTN4_9SPHN|nr:NADP-dependent oxidoreductase [Sphingomonas oleivorans]PTQ07431.1 NADPH:quinone oxidoreductase [Sphingomonas oleivorans]
MRALRIHDHGDIASVRLEDVPIPEPSLDEVLIRVEAASINPLDLLLLGGARREIFPLTFPYTLGTDLAGTVERVGPLAVRWKPGDRVFARPVPTRGGAFAEFALVPARHVAAAPAGLPLAECAGLPTAAGTAWEALFEVARLRAGQALLVHAGAGGVGSFAVQFGKIAGARVIATASGDGVPLVHGLGADMVIDYRQTDFTTCIDGVDIVLDTVGGETQERSYPLLKNGGVLVSITTPVNAEKAAAHGTMAMRMGHATDGTRLALIAALYDAGHLQVVIDRTYALEEGLAALEHSASRRARGKILLGLA